MMEPALLGAKKARRDALEAEKKSIIGHLDAQDPKRQKEQMDRLEAIDQELATIGLEITGLRASARHG